MQTLETKNKTYLLDDDGFLVDPWQWDEGFAEGMAPKLGITDRLSASHWKILKFIRATYLETGSCPVVHKTCKTQNLHLKELERLFPSGYQRGACKLAGISFMAEGVCSSLYRRPDIPPKLVSHDTRVYRVNVQGFLIDPSEWDEDYAIFKARELGMPGSLNEEQWHVLRYLRLEFAKNHEIPTVYATCAAVGIDIDAFAELFPCGYHRGAVKIAGLSLAAKAPLGEPVAAAPKRP
ncbi:MAG: TusE/DsrC/DsvC family sulfur relay protein [Syntrophobacteraceae bacterium]